MPARRQSGVTVDGSAASYPSSEGKRSKDSKEKESFGCPFPGCGQVSSCETLLIMSSADDTSRTVVWNISSDIRENVSHSPKSKTRAEYKQTKMYDRSNVEIAPKLLREGEISHLYT